MNVAVIDVGSNTARLLVAQVDERSVMEIRRERQYLRLGDDVHAYGRIQSAKLAETGEVARRFARIARKAGAERLETVVTAPGRQAENGDELVELLSGETGASVVQLTGEDEGRLAWEGAVARMEHPSDVVAVIDLGGGSCELAVGVTDVGPTWVRSIDAGALRISRSYLSGSPTAADNVLVARQALRRLMAGFDPPNQDVALVAGGTARAVARVIGTPFGAENLEGLATSLQRIPLTAFVASHGITEARAQTLLGGTLVLAELAHHLDAELAVARGGLREGAALMLSRAALAAA